MANKNASLGQMVQNNPLGLPPGSVRAIIAIGAVAITGYMMAKNIKIPTFWIAIITMVIRDFFAKPK